MPAARCTAQFIARKQTDMPSPHLFITWTSTVIDFHEDIPLYKEGWVWLVD